MHLLHQVQVIPVSREDLWDFISTPLNLNRITPPEMSFEILGEAPARTYAGQLIEYQVKIPLLGRTRWISEITELDEGVSFVDEQRKGPYKSWVHLHLLEEVEGGVKMTDEVRYLMPFGPFGKLARLLFVKRALARIFQYRRHRIDEIFPR